MAYRCHPIVTQFSHRFLPQTSKASHSQFSVLTLDFCEQMNPPRSFANVSIYLAGQATSIGTVTLLTCPLCSFIYFRDDRATGSLPFNGPFLLSPLTPPYQEQDGHRIFSLSFYSELTVIEDPVRLCFHDATQEFGISLNFTTQSEFSELFEYLHNEMTIVSPNLPGFFQIRRFRRAFSLNESFDQHKKRLKENFLNEPYVCNEDILLQAHSEIVRIITDMIGGSAQSPNLHLPKATAEQINDAISNSRESVVDLLHRHSVPAPMKAIVWGFLIGLHPLDNFDRQLKQQYLTVRSQWKTVTESQLMRSKLLLARINRCTAYIEANRQQFISVVVTHPAILTLAFNIFMCVSHVFNFIEKHFDVLKHFVRLFLWMFVQDISMEVPDRITFVGPSGLEYDEDTLEALIFWSIVFVFEAGETRRLLEISNPDENETIETISDFIFLVYPSMFKHLHQIGVKNYDRLIPFLTGHFCTLLPLCDCIDLWLAAAASPSFLEFTQFMLISCLFLTFPNLVLFKPNADQDLQPVIEQAFEFIDHRYLEKASFSLGKRGRAMVEEKLRASSENGHLLKGFKVKMQI
jgi:hypothetical protein